MINQVILIGTVKSEPTTRGIAVSFRMTTWRMHHDGRRFDSTHSVEVFGKSKEMASALQVGQMIAVQGSIKHSNYEKNGQKKWFTSVSALSVTPVGEESGTLGHSGQSPFNQGESQQTTPGSAPPEYPPSGNGGAGNQQVDGSVQINNPPYKGFNDQYGF